MDHYKKILLEVNDLIDNNQNKKALTIIDEELSMPYIPKETEELLHSFKQALEIKEPVQAKQITEEDVELGLNSSEPMVIASTIALLESSNIRQFMKQIKFFLISGSENILKNSMLDLLINQDIDDNIEINYNDKSAISFNPSKIESFMSKSNLDLYHTILDDVVVGFDISLYSTAKQLLEILLLEGYPNEKLNNYYKVCLGLTLKANRLLGSCSSEKEIISLFDLNMDDAKNALNFINSIIK